MAYRSDWTIYAGDTDYTGRIYTPTVIDYTIRTLEQFRRTVGFTEERMAEIDISQPGRHVEMEYLGAIRVGDVLEVAIEPTIGETSVTHEVTCTVDDEVVAAGNLTVVYIDTDTEEPTPVPEEIREELVAIAAD